MLYVFDTSSLIILRNYYPKRFPSFWDRFEEAVSDGKVISVREVLGEIDGYGGKDHLNEWVKGNRNLFHPPGQPEVDFITKIFSVPHFDNLVPRRSIVKGTPVADPFVIASAKVRDGCVVTEEKNKQNAAKIPNVCDHFKIEADAWVCQEFRVCSYS